MPKTEEQIRLRHILVSHPHARADCPAYADRAPTATGQADAAHLADGHAGRRDSRHRRRRRLGAHSHAAAAAG